MAHCPSRTGGAAASCNPAERNPMPSGGHETLHFWHGCRDRTGYRMPLGTRRNFTAPKPDGDRTWRSRGGRHGPRSTGIAAFGQWARMIGG